VSRPTHLSVHPPSSSRLIHFSWAPNSCPQSIVNPSIFNRWLTYVARHLGQAPLGMSGSQGDRAHPLQVCFIRWLDMCLVCRIIQPMPLSFHPTHHFGDAPISSFGGAPITFPRLSSSQCLNLCHKKSFVESFLGTMHAQGTPTLPYMKTFISSFTPSILFSRFVHLGLWWKCNQ
jgi:hypothetical protein